MEASRDVLSPDSANIVRTVMLGAVQILSQHIQVVLELEDSVMKDLLFNAYIPISQGYKHWKEIFKPYQQVTNFFSSYLNCNFYKALGGLLEKLYGNSIAQLPEEYQDIYHEVTFFSCEESARQIIGALASGIDENSSVYLNALVLYFSEPFSPDWYEEIQKIQPILKIPREIEGTIVVSAFHLNMFLYLNGPEDTRREQFKKNLFEYRQWFYEDVELTSCQLASVATVCMEQGNLQELSEWINGLSNRVTNQDVLNYLHSRLRLMRPFGAICKKAQFRL